MSGEGGSGKFRGERGRARAGNIEGKGAGDPPKGDRGGNEVHAIKLAFEQRCNILDRYSINAQAGVYASSPANVAVARESMMRDLWREVLDLHLELSAIIDEGNLKAMLVKAEENYVMAMASVAGKGGQFDGIGYEKEEKGDWDTRNASGNKEGCQVDG